MKNTYQISLKAIDNPAHLEDMMKALQRAFRKFDVDYIIIGAFARDFWLKYIHQMPESKRKTKDIDVAIILKTMSQFEELKDYLIKEEDFRATHNKFRMISKEGIEIDLSPFGDIELEEGYENWVTNHSNSRKPSTLGLKEASANKEIMSDDTNNVDFKVITLEGLVMLKIIAWNDRPEIRQKDAQDVAYILDNYYDTQLENIFENHWDLLDEENAADIPWIVGARVLGRNMQKVVNLNEALKSNVIQILESQITDSFSILANAMVNDKGDYQRRLGMLKLLSRGLNDE